MKKEHKEISMKVNAWVDEGVAPLVEALNCFNQIITLNCCQGKDESPAFVYFSHRGTPSDLFDFIQALSANLGETLKADSEYRFEITWLAGTDTPLAVLYCYEEMIGRLSAHIETQSHLIG